MRPPLPDFLPSNMSADEMLRAIEPCFTPELFRSFTDAMQAIADKRATAENECAAENAENERARALEDKSAALELLSGMVEGWRALQEPVPWTDRAQWSATVSRMSACAAAAHEKGLLT